MLSITFWIAVTMGMALSQPAAAQAPPRPVLQQHPITAAESPSLTAATALPKVSVRESDTPLQLGGQTYHFVARIQHIEASGATAGDETTEWWELRDPKGTVLCRQNYRVTLIAGGFDETEAVDARAFTTKLGSGVLVEGMALPSAPGSGGWVQVFGFQYGPTKATNLTAFGPPIAIEGELLDIAPDPERRAPPPMPGRTVIVMNDILRFRLRTGNFSIVYPVLINWITGKVEPSWHCLRITARGQVERCDYAVEETMAVQRTERTFVRLFAEPDESFIPSHIVVEPQSKIEFLKAEVPISWTEDQHSISFGVAADGDIWLQVRIDGHEGWIHSQEDFEAIGLPQTG